MSVFGSSVAAAVRPNCDSDSSFWFDAEPIRWLDVLFKIEMINVIATGMTGRPFGFRFLHFPRQTRL
jgi:hypothetical protein